MVQTEYLELERKGNYAWFMINEHLKVSNLWNWDAWSAGLLLILSDTSLMEDWNCEVQVHLLKSIKFSLRLGLYQTQYQALIHRYTQNIEMLFFFQNFLVLDWFYVSKDKYGYGD